MKTPVQTTVAIEVAEIYHAKLGPSGADGWINCSQWAGGGDATFFAAEGSVMHEIGAECIVSGDSAHTYVGKLYKSDGFDITFTSGLAEAVQTYVDIVRAKHAAKGGELLVEQSLDISQITGEKNAVGTTDTALIPGLGDTELEIIDLKGGAGVGVEAEDNKQLQMYALSAMDEFSLVAEFKTVKMTIIQPRKQSVSEWTQTVEQLEAFRLVAIEAAANHGTGPATPGAKQCRWCTKKATCSALNDEVFDVVCNIEPADASDDLAIAMGKADMVEVWLKAIRAEVEKRLLDGRTVQGYKLVQGKKGNRAWTNPTEAEALLKQMRVPHELMYDYSVISPTTAVKLAPKLDKDGKPLPPKEGAPAPVIGPRQYPKVLALITQSDGKPSVAAESDKRPALVIEADDFQSVGSDEEASLV